MDAYRQVIWSQTTSGKTALVECFFAKRHEQIEEADEDATKLGAGPSAWSDEEDDEEMRSGSVAKKRRQWGVTLAPGYARENYHNPPRLNLKPLPASSGDIAKTVTASSIASQTRRIYMLCNKIRELNQTESLLSTRQTGVVTNQRQNDSAPHGALQRRRPHFSGF